MPKGPNVWIVLRGSKSSSNQNGRRRVRMYCAMTPQSCRCRNSMLAVNTVRRGVTMAGKRLVTPDANRNIRAFHYDDDDNSYGRHSLFVARE